MRLNVRTEIHLADPARGPTVKVGNNPSCSPAGRESTMKLYGGIDLHLNNSVLALLDEDVGLVYRKRLANDAPGILEALAPYREAIVGLVVESTYNGYWLVDALKEAGYWVHLANTAAIVQYSGFGRPAGGDGSTH